MNLIFIVPIGSLCSHVKGLKPRSAKGFSPKTNRFLLQKIEIVRFIKRGNVGSEWKSVEALPKVCFDLIPYNLIKPILEVVDKIFLAIERGFL